MTAAEVQEIDERIGVVVARWHLMLATERGGKVDALSHDECVTVMHELRDAVLGADQPFTQDEDEPPLR